MVDELSRGQTRDWRTHGHTHAGNDNTRRPKLASGKYYYNTVKQKYDSKQKILTHVPLTLDHQSISIVCKKIKY